MPEVRTEYQMAFPSPSQLFTPAVTTFLILMVVGYALVNYMQDFVLNYLVLVPQSFTLSRIWQLFTYPYFNDCNLIFNGLVLFFLGSAVEREWRTKSFLQMWLLVTVVCSLIWLIVNLIGNWNFVGMGVSPCVYGVIGTFGMLYRKKRFFALFWTIEGHYISWILIVIGLVIGIAVPISLIWVAGAGVAYLYIKLLRKIADRKSSSIYVATTGKKDSKGFIDID